MDGSPRRWLPRGRAADVAVVLVVIAIVTVVTLISTPAPNSILPPLLSWPVQLTACVALYWRRGYPHAVMVVTLVLAATYYALSGEGSPVMVTVMITLYSIAASGRLRASIAWTAALMVITVGSELASPVRHLGLIGLAMFTGWCVAIVAVGVTVHDRSLLLAETKHRAEETALREAAQERLRIAREVHDVVGHHISLINVQASAALHRIHRDPAQAETALATIKSASGRTLRELRTTLEVLRQSGEAAPVSPASGMTRIGGLVEGVRTSGIAIDYRVEGTVREVPVDVELAGYRIVQEALTNVVKHADASQVTVRLTYRDEAVAIEVTDDGGPGAENNPTGHGIRGMAERAEALGGELSAGAEPGGGFAVRCTLPAPTMEPT